MSNSIILSMDDTDIWNLWSEHYNSHSHLTGDVIRRKFQENYNCYIFHEKVNGSYFNKTFVKFYNEHDLLMAKLGSTLPLDDAS
jgi:hypothetical protein